MAVQYNQEWDRWSLTILYILIFIVRVYWNSPLSIPVYTVTMARLCCRMDLDTNNTVNNTDYCTSGKILIAFHQLLNLIYNPFYQFHTI